MNAELVMRLQIASAVKILAFILHHPTLLSMSSSEPLQVQALSWLLSMKAISKTSIILPRFSLCSNLPRIGLDITRR